MKLYLVRHAQSLRNANVEDHHDSSLNETGKGQAKRLGMFFKKHAVAHAYCSELQRAKDTLKEIIPYIPKVPITYTKKINEHNMGIFQQNGKDDWKSFGSAVEKSNLSFVEFIPEGGESLIETSNRAKKFYQYLLKNHQEESILIVGHGIFLLYLILNALGLSISEGKYYNLSNASVSQLEINKEGKVTHYHVNDYHHLIEGGLEKLK